MSPRMVKAAAFGIGFAAGLRSLLAPAVLARSAGKKLLFREFPIAGLVSGPASKKMVKLAVGELVADKLPFTPNRTSPGPLVARLASGAACGAAVCYLARESAKEGAILGGAGALAGTYGGFYARRSFSRRYPDLAVALVEDGLALALAFGIARQLKRSL